MSTKTDNIENTIVTLKRKPTNENCATIVRRLVKFVDRKKKRIHCDDNIMYRYRDLL